MKSVVMPSGASNEARVLYPSDSAAAPVPATILAVVAPPGGYHLGMLRLFFSGMAIVATLAFPAIARADTTACTLSFAMRGYSHHFEQSVGRGTIVCDNGQKATVEILGRGADLPNGAGAFTDGKGTFSAVLDISALLGSYVLPAAARVGNARPLGVAGAMSNGQATITFPATGAAAKMPATFGRISMIAHPLSY